MFSAPHKQICILLVSHYTLSPCSLSSTNACHWWPLSCHQIDMSQPCVLVPLWIDGTQLMIHSHMYNVYCIKTHTSEGAEAQVVAPCGCGAVEYAQTISCLV